MERTRTVTLTPDNYAKAKAAILFALSKDLAPTFIWQGNLRGLTPGKVYSFIGLDKDGDLKFKDDDNTTCYASSSNCVNGCFELNISHEKLDEYSQQLFAQTVDHLRQLKATFEKKHVFVAGDLIQWKPNMRDRPFPEYGSPVIVLETITPAHQSTDNWEAEEAPSKYDLVIGISLSGALRHFYADSRRYEPFPLKPIH